MTSSGGAVGVLVTGGAGATTDHGNAGVALFAGGAGTTSEHGTSSAATLATPTVAPASGPPVAVFAPASIGNLAAGFDVLGAALAPLVPLEGEPFGDVVTASLAAEDTLVCSGPWAARLPVEPRHNLVWRAKEAVARQLGGPLPALALTLLKGLPVASGLGSSAASAVAAVVAIDEVLGNPLGAAGRLAAAAETEACASGATHLDNVAPILFGGVQLIGAGDRVRALPWPEELIFVVLQPELELSTRQARAVLPRQVPLALAVAHAQNLAVLVHALHAEDRELLATCLRDLLVEPHRAPLVPGFAAVKAAALAAGALGCSLSGAGPAVFAVAAADGAAAVGEAAAAAWRAAGVACQVRLCKLDRRGARCVR